MATRNDLYNYSGYSFEKFVDLVLQLQADNTDLSEENEELKERVIGLDKRVIDAEALLG